MKTYIAILLTIIVIGGGYALLDSQGVFIKIGEAYETHKEKTAFYDKLEGHSDEYKELSWEHKIALDNLYTYLPTHNKLLNLWLKSMGDYDAKINLDNSTTILTPLLDECGRLRTEIANHNEDK